MPNPTQPQESDESVFERVGQLIKNKKISEIENMLPDICTRLEKSYEVNGYYQYSLIVDLLKLAVGYHQLPLLDSLLKQNIVIQHLSGMSYTGNELLKIVRSESINAGKLDQEKNQIAMRLLEIPAVQKKDIERITELRKQGTGLYGSDELACMQHGDLCFINNEFKDAIDWYIHKNYNMDGISRLVYMLSSNLKHIIQQAPENLDLFIFLPIKFIDNPIIEPLLQDPSVLVAIKKHAKHIIGLARNYSDPALYTRLLEIPELQAADKLLDAQFGPRFLDDNQNQQKLGVEFEQSYEEYVKAGNLKAAKELCLRYLPHQEARIKLLQLFAEEINKQLQDKKITSDDLLPYINANLRKREIILLVAGQENLIQNIIDFCETKKIDLQIFADEELQKSRQIDELKYGICFGLSSLFLSAAFITDMQIESKPTSAQDDLKWFYKCLILLSSAQDQLSPEQSKELERFVGIAIHFQNSLTSLPIKTNVFGVFSQDRDVQQYDHSFSAEYTGQKTIQYNLDESLLNLEYKQPEIFLAKVKDVISQSGPLYIHFSLQGFARHAVSLHKNAKGGFTFLDPKHGLRFVKMKDDEDIKLFCENFLHGQYKFPLISIIVGKPIDKNELKSHRNIKF